MKKVVSTSNAPAAIGPYSQAIISNGFAFVSGQIPLDPATGEMVTGDITAQTRRVFDNLTAVAKAAGGSLADIVRVGIYVTDLGNFAAVNAVMAGATKRARMDCGMATEVRPGAPVAPC